MTFTIINIALVIYILITPIEGSKCFGNLPDINPRNVYFEGKPLNITLQVSNKITQNLFNGILKILLEEVLGYEKVNFVDKRVSSNFSTMMEKLYDSNESLHLHRKIPNVMINLEVPISPDIDYKNSLDFYLFSECGNIAPSGRYGWFIPYQLYNFSQGADRWEYFLDYNRTNVFNLDLEHTKMLENFAYDNETKQFYCNADFCKNGYYIPEHCDNGSCAVLLTSYLETTEFIIEHIKELRLYIKVLWIGSNLKTAIDKLTDSILKTKLNKSIIFLEWTPGYFTFEYDKFKSVYLPRCEDFHTETSQKCIYEMSKNVKLVWSELRNIANPAFEVIYKMNFDQNSYENLLRIFKNNIGKPNIDTACHWLKQNDVWRRWLPSNSDKKNIYIGGIFPLSGVTYNAHGIVLAARMAQDAINHNSSILKDYNLKLLVNDGQCHADMVLKTFIDYIYHNEYRDLIGILGPACSDTLEPLAGVSKHYSTVVISYSAEGSTFSDRSRYPYFFRSNGENDQYKQVYLRLFQELNWNRVAALTEDGQKYTEYISSMGNLLETNGINLIANVKFSSNRKESSLIRHLEDLKEKRAKIIIADTYDNIARVIMCQAYNLNMIGKHGYVWFLPAWLSHNWYNTTHYNTFFNENVNCSVDAMIEAITGHFSLQHASFAPDDSIMQENISVKSWRTKYLKRVSKWSHSQSVKTANTSLALNDDYASDYAGYAYDAVWIYALAAEKLLNIYPESFSDMHSEFTTMNLVDIIRQTEFNGVSGKIKFYGGPSRYSTIHIKQWLNDTKVIVGYFTPNMSNPQGEMGIGILHLNISNISWQTPLETKPDDGFILPEQCLLQPLADFLNISCENAIILVNVVSFTVFGMLLLTFIILLKRKYDKKIKLTEDYMKAIGFDKSAAINLSSLDKWETSRECVVINRKLGEGAFGMVYGGEALLTEGDGWVAVAVKTLKIGANREEKLDFLSEAESMKRFDHKNIVKLLGVCTKNEPFYTIMEYMLYGDLKTYLLARRHLVNGMYTEEKDEISCKKLTSMALDIARALSYLAELKYVHRDVACRNCLINAQRVVKLGDFGMSRLMFENDYYRFNRKGMLPVRWMAPESLCLGIFTPASDVWSFAILLYEIITFGNFPFQGMSNNEVLEYVKGGRTLAIPNGVKPQLEGLMKSCWNMDYKIRPNASEVAEFLANSPRLLSPCLDVPLSSVAMDFSDDIDALPEIFSGQMVMEDIDRPDNEITNLTMPSSQHFDNPSYIIGEIHRKKMKKTRKRPLHRDVIIEECQTDEEVTPFI